MVDIQTCTFSTKTFSVYNTSDTWRACTRYLKKSTKASRKLWLNFDFEMSG